MTGILLFKDEKILDHDIFRRNHSIFSAQQFQSNLLTDHYFSIYLGITTLILHLFLIFTFRLIYQGTSYLFNFFLN